MPGRVQSHSGGFRRTSWPTVISRAEPEYPEEALRAKLAGKVRLAIVVNKEGLPQDIRVVRGLGLGLDEAAVEAVGKWRFNPATRDGEPIAVRATVLVMFPPPRRRTHTDRQARPS